MGAASSTQTKYDPVTGKTKTKHKMGGSYPGNRRTANAPYAPPASDFHNGQATSHFVSYGGGNALVLKEGGLAQPQVGATTPGPQYIQVTLPEGVHAGQAIRVAAPDGRLNEIVIPAGFGPGSTFTVEFADPDDKPADTTGSSYAYEGTGTATAAAPASSYGSRPAAPPASARPVPPPQNNDYDDGFATGFNNPNFVPQAAATTTAAAAATTTNDFSSYPSAIDAQPVYAPYVSKPY
eukprot:jgi/Psemu1/304523/fgenesh1_kg.157_\